MTARQWSDPASADRLSRPTRSSTLAIRSLTEPNGFWLSIFATIRTLGFGDNAQTSTMGVLPIMSSTLSLTYIADLSRAPILITPIRIIAMVRTTCAARTPTRIPQPADPPTIPRSGVTMTPDRGIVTGATTMTMGSSAISPSTIR